jgi:hypothetical protein
VSGAARRETRAIWRKLDCLIADHLNSLLNRTVTDARLALHGSSVRLLVVHALQVTGEHCQPAYQYRLSLGEDKQRGVL